MVSAVFHDPTPAVADAEAATAKPAARVIQKESVPVQTTKTSSAVPLHQRLGALLNRALPPFLGLALLVVLWSIVPGPSKPGSRRWMCSAIRSTATARMIRA